LGCFSEAQGVFDPELLKQVFLDRSSEVPVSWGDARPAHLADTLKLVDGTLLPALIYRYRWQIELFFKWLKSILGCRHLMAESPAGVAIQIYSALIAALMLQLLTGKRPGKRAMELILFYLMGHAELDELVALLGLEKSAR
jgi:IS4 transposase